tara:strand:- start:2622 stop:3299 length:678 start_codon:yes stop_codon:yes gene_type:complete
MSKPEDEKKEEIFDLLDEIKKLETKREKLNESIEEIDVFSTKLKDKINEEDINNEIKTYKKIIEKEKMKNENELNILSQQNEKMEKYLELLAKQNELELKYMEQYCEYKSRVEKICEKYAHIKFNEIPKLRDLFYKQLNESNTDSVYPKNVNKPLDKIVEPVISNTSKNSVNTEPTAQRRHTISEIVKNPEMNENKNDIRQSGSLNDQLRHAFKTQFKSLREDDE